MLPITQAEQWRHNWLSSSCCRYSPFPASSSFMNSLKLSFIFTLTDVFLCSGHPSFLGLAVLLYSLLHIQLLLLKYSFFFFFVQSRLHTAFSLHSPLFPCPSLPPLTHALFSLFSHLILIPPCHLIQDFSRLLCFPNYSLPSSGFLLKTQCSPLQWLFIELAAKMHYQTVRS